MKIIWLKHFLTASLTYAFAITAEWYVAARLHHWADLSGHFTGIPAAPRTVRHTTTAQEVLVKRMNAFE